ncbi:hypothetical protein EMIT0210MI2_12297 [Priestia megaterium]|uniref:hypothetical protein n=1 Tax=Priestia megaterium TaxID=1404 RepID=UPI0039DFF360
MNKKTPLSTYTLKNLMLEALGYTEKDIDPEGHYFKQFDYAGTQNDLFRITEGLAIKKGMLSDDVKLPRTAWGCHGHNLFENSNTNFSQKEIERLFEAFSILLNQNVISPGMYRNSPFLPFFHVTDHGLKCIEENEILPYDSDGYLDQIRKISAIDNWVLYYMTEAIKCFNSGCYNAATVMIGLSAEKITLDLIESFKNYLNKHKTSFIYKNGFTFQGDIDQAFITAVDNERHISVKYSKFIKYFNNIKNHDSTISGILDPSARNTFYDFIRLSRNEVSHPSDIIKNETETLLIFISFIKYVKLQTKLTSVLNTI